MANNTKKAIEVRTIKEAIYTINHKATVRCTAKKFSRSKSTVHKDLRERLPLLNPSLSAKVDAVLMQNKSERHIRGGRATQMKYMLQNSLKK